MSKANWPTKLRSTLSLHPDARNPRLGGQLEDESPRAIIQYLFRHDKALDIAKSIVSRGYFPNEPLLAINEEGRTVVVEGNRRLAALKALRDPNLLDEKQSKVVERLRRQLTDPSDLDRVPVTIAPSRKATDRQLAGRHIGTPVLPWEAENRATFILDKLEEGYSNDQLRDQLGFTLADIQSARQTRAIADMARAIELPEDVSRKLASPRTRLFTTIERVFDSSIGREYLMIQPDPDYGVRGNTTKTQFLRGFTRLVTDVALGNRSSRSLNTNENIEDYFKSLDPIHRPERKRGSFVPEDIINSQLPQLGNRKPQTKPQVAKPKSISASVVPRNLKVRYGDDRLVDIRRELVKLKRHEFPNAGAVLLRVFFELSVLDYLKRRNELEGIVEKIEKRQNGNRLPFGTPTMKQLVPEIQRIANEKLTTSEARKVEKALRYDASAPFSISELHGFVHHSDFPGERDILQFWKRTEPLFRLMLEQDHAEPSE